MLSEVDAGTEADGGLEAATEVDAVAAALEGLEAAMEADAGVALEVDTGEPAGAFCWAQPASGNAAVTKTNSKLSKVLFFVIETSYSPRRKTLITGAGLDLLSG